ncbi:MAG: hypothetical protein K2W96_20370 [Gemmataceae bacterium]|nr:hypothetical protein [Gemmataceae bacterium]
MGITEPWLFANDEGVWREDTPGHPFGISWDEVFAVSGHKIDGVTEVFACVVLDWDYGEFIELYQHWPGFTQVVEAITARLPGIAPDWLARIETCGVDAPSLEVWHRERPGSP